MKFDLSALFRLFPQQLQHLAIVPSIIRVLCRFPIDTFPGQGRRVLCLGH